MVDDHARRVVQDARDYTEAIRNRKEPSSRRPVSPILVPGEFLQEKPGASLMHLK
jgi:hypothetical protein